MSPADVPAPSPSLSPSLWSRLRQRRLVRWGMDLGLIVLIFVGVNLWQTRDHVRGLAPALDVATLDGGRLSLDDLRGKPAVVVFWAPWCTVCAQEADNLDRA
jgi:thiol-disulfide isomerase/thioredoxin